VARLRGIGGRSTKNEEPYRAVPLTTAAVAILTELKSRDGNIVKLTRGKVFRATASAIKQSWERAVARARDTYERETLMAGLIANGMNEQDAMAEIRKVKRSDGRMPTKPKPPHKGTRMLARYYHPRAGDLARKLG
jgi:hypothetical protein